MRRAAEVFLVFASVAFLGCAPGAAGIRPLTAVSQPESGDEGSKVPTGARAAEPREAILLPAEGGAFVAHDLAGSAIDAVLRADARCPENMALIAGRVCVDRWEASVVERAITGNPGRWWSPFLPVDGHESSVRAVSVRGVIPQGYISGRQAALACDASGKRLCTKEEWERACRGPEDHQYPYGDIRRAGLCNDDPRPIHPVAEGGALLGIAANALWREGMNQALINQLPNTLLPTGERAECTNPYGVHDMVGNLHEWIDDPDGTFRGGYYMDTSKNGEGCAYQTTAHDFTYHDYSTGFRCCMDAERVE